MPVSAMQFTTRQSEIAARAACHHARPALSETGDAPERPELIVADEADRPGVREAGWTEFMRALRRFHLGLAHGGDLRGLLLVREDELPLPGLPDIQQ